MANGRGDMANASWAFWFSLGTQNHVSDPPAPEAPGGQFCAQNWSKTRFLRLKNPEMSKKRFWKGFFLGEPTLQISGGE